MGMAVGASANLCSGGILDYAILLAGCAIAPATGAAVTEFSAGRVDGQQKPDSAAATLHRPPSKPPSLSEKRLRWAWFL